MRKAVLLIAVILSVFQIVSAIDANPGDYPKIVQFAKENADKKADARYRFWKATDLSISETSTGKQYHIWLLYLTRDGLQQYYYVTVYENPWGELVIYDISENGMMAAFKRRFV